MKIIITSAHMLQAHKDRALIAYLETIEHHYGNYDAMAELFPRVSGRALRSLMLNAPMLVPELATPTFEYVAANFTPMTLHPVYHALVLGDQNSFDEFNKKIQTQFGFFRNRQVGLELLIALLYLLTAIQKTWTLNKAQEDAIKFLLFRAAESIRYALEALRGLDANLDPIRAVYVRSYRDGSEPDETVAVADAIVLAKYLTEGYTMDQLIERVAKRDTSTMFVSKV